MCFPLFEGEGGRRTQFPKKHLAIGDLAPTKPGFAAGPLGHENLDHYFESRQVEGPSGAVVNTYKNLICVSFDLARFGPVKPAAFEFGLGFVERE